MSAFASLVTPGWFRSRYPARTNRAHSSNSRKPETRHRAEDCPRLRPVRGRIGQT